MFVLYGLELIFSFREHSGLENNFMKLVRYKIIHAYVVISTFRVLCVTLVVVAVD